MWNSAASVLEVAEALAARGMGAIPARAQRLLCGGAPRVLDGQELDPGMQLLLKAAALRGASTIVSGPDATPEQERARSRREGRPMWRWPTPVGSVHELLVEGQVGALRARHYRPFDAAGAPLLVFFHGGGFVIGDLETHDEPCRLLCRHGGVHVLSVDYRLAPEHPFPAPLQDAIAASHWALANAGSLGADPDRVGIGGDSAGGNLSAVTAQQLAHEHGDRLALQLLIYPSTDMAEPSRSDRLFGEGFLLTAACRQWFEGHYTNGADLIDPRISPLRASGLEGLAPAIVVTAALDPLRDEGEAYVRAMRRAGNHVLHSRADGLIHGFINFTSVNRRSRDVVIAIAGMLRAEFAR